jgi:hypothetical protein
VRAGQAGADVEELPDARLRRQVPDRAAEEAPVGAHPGHDLRPEFDDLLARRPVSREVVFTEIIVINAGHSAVE